MNVKYNRFDVVCIFSPEIVWNVMSVLRVDPSGLRFHPSFLLFQVSALIP